MTTKEIFNISTEIRDKFLKKFLKENGIELEDFFKNINNEN